MRTVSSSKMAKDVSTTVAVANSSRGCPPGCRLVPYDHGEPHVVRHKTGKLVRFVDRTIVNLGKRYK